MLTNVRSRKLELDYSADVVKNCIKKVVEVGAMYKMLNSEDLLGTYRFMGMSGISISFIVSATVHKLDDQKTSVEFEVSSSSRDVDGQLCLQMLDDYLKVFAQALEGKEVTNQTVSSSNSSGCMVAAAILILSTLCLCFASCNPDDPEPNNENPQTMPPEQFEYFIEYTDNGTLNHFEATGQTIPLLRSLAHDNAAESYYTGMSFDLMTPSDFTDNFMASVVLPIDSSHIDEMPLNQRCLQNDSSDWWTDYGYVYRGAMRFTKVGQSGEDQNIDEADTTEYYNKVTSIVYLGNHRYDTVEHLLLCDYVIEGEFRIRVINDLTNAVRILESGSYKMRVSVIAE